MVVAKAFIFEKQFNGFPQETDLKLVEEELPDIKDGEFLAEAVYLSVDPYMRAYAPRLPLGDTFVGGQIAKIIESKNPKYPVGKYVEARFGWRTHTISDGKRISEWSSPMILPDFGDLPISLGLGVLGMPGITAYFGVTDILLPEIGQTVIVTGAAGAVGSHVGQIAKLKGCKVIGVVGSDEKGKWLVDELGFDHFINYKTDDISKVLQEIAPQGIDRYFDNVGGEISSTIINNHMKNFGRIAVCGCISGYNEKSLPTATPVQGGLVTRQLRMQGLHCSRWEDRWMESILQNRKWVEDGRIKYRETITEGFENMFNAFTDMLRGGNFGKALVKV
ncbi:prostaglandin reductase 1 [Anoplophora glabripennis]|nr:prostaglandin reductase 1 [Anoplophora glabripennis]